VALGCLRGLAAGYVEQSREVLRTLVKRRHDTPGHVPRCRLVVEPPAASVRVRCQEGAVALVG